jgi:TonB family protein
MASVGCSRYQLREAGLPIPLPWPPIRHSVAVDGDSGALVMTTFVSGRVTLALVNTRGAGVSIHTDSIGAAEWADSAARIGAATLHDTASGVGTITIERVDSAYRLSAVQRTKAVSIMVKDSVLFAVLHGATRTPTFQHVRSSVYDETVVELTARGAPDNPLPHYPMSLRRKRIQGVVIAQFVVDSAGFLRPETLRFLQSPDPAFSESVEAALAHSRFYPAMLGGRPVSQLVRQSFTFSLE